MGEPSPLPWSPVESPTGRPRLDRAFLRIAGELPLAACELFAAYGVAIDCSFSPVALPTENEHACMAIIRYAGEGIRGSLVLLAPKSAVLAWLEAAGLEPLDEGDFVDALGEFSNMLLGHLKGRLLRQGLSFDCTIPTAVSGCGLQPSAAPARSTWATCDGQGWQVGVRLDVAFAPNFEFARNCSQCPPAGAGEAVLFESQRVLAGRK